MKTTHLRSTLASILTLSAASPLALHAADSMDKMWGDATTKDGVESSERAALLRDGNYGMFIHWGLFSSLGGQWKDQTFYGIGEWIKRQMKISDEEYMGLAKDFNPSEFDAREIVRVAKEAGMKYIVITSKHHEGFAMFKSAHAFNIVDATPFHRDPMKELSVACREAGLGFGFYYSHFQDWTSPGAEGGATTNSDGSTATFDKYFREKCYPQVDEICSNYGPLAFIWFDTPGSMSKEDLLALEQLVRKKQPNAMLNSRIGQGLGDYESLGDMEVPRRNHQGLWETPDTTNDSWSYAWYDQNWKTPKEILHRLVSTVGRGGTYLLNVGPDGKGRIPAPAARYLVEAGQWVKQHPGAVYGASASPWGVAQPWGDITRTGNTLNAVVFDWPADRKIYLSGLVGKIDSVTLHQQDGDLLPLPASKSGTWTVIDAAAADAGTVASLAGLIEIKLASPAKVDQTPGIHPNIPTTLYGEFATARNAESKVINWMEKFGEWKFAHQISDWKPGGVAEWNVDVAAAGDYFVELTYKGEGRPVWAVTTSEGAKIQNQQAASPVYKAYPTGILRFAKPGKHTVSVSLLDVDPKTSSLQAIRFSPVGQSTGRPSSNISLSSDGK
jgi:alpha-L-fucosidase